MFGQKLARAILAPMLAAFRMLQRSQVRDQWKAKHRRFKRAEPMRGQCRLSVDSRVKKRMRYFRRFA